MPYFGSTAGCVSSNAARFSAAVTRASASAARHALNPITSLNGSGDHKRRGDGGPECHFNIGQAGVWIVVQWRRRWHRHRVIARCAEVPALVCCDRHGGDDSTIHSSARPADDDKSCASVLP